MALNILNKKEEEVDAQKYPNVAMFNALNKQVLNMLGLAELEKEITDQAHNEVNVAHLQGGLPLYRSA